MHNGDKMIAAACALLFLAFSLVVLPCKRGAELWMFRSGPCKQIYATQVKDISTLNGVTVLNTTTCGVLDAGNIGTGIFFTREEVEKALEGTKDV